MDNITTILQEVGPAGIIGVIAWQAFSYLLKSASKKNEIIGTQISKTVEALQVLTESFREQRELLNEVAVEFKDLVKELKRDESRN